MTTNTEPRTGSLLADEVRLTIIVSRFNSRITRRLMSGALQAVDKYGVDSSRVQLLEVPGAWEIPLLARKVACDGKADAVIALGAVIRGETAHFDFVAGEAARGLAQVQADTGVPVVFGVLTTENAAQAMERSGGTVGNKGAEAVETALEMVNLLRGNYR